MKIQTRARHALVAVVITCFMLPQTLWAQGSVDEQPTAAAMAGDLVVARPIGLAITVIGTAAFVVSLPFTLLAGSVGEAADTLMIGPAESTFMRCLGCTNVGYSNKDIERNEQKKEEAAAM